MSKSKKVDQELLIDIMKDEARPIDILGIINKQYDTIRDIKRNNSKLTKVQQAYIDEEEQKLSYLEDLMRKAVRDAYAGKENVYAMTNHFGNMLENFEIKVYVKLR